MKSSGRHSTTSAVSAGAIGTVLGLVNALVGFGFQAALAATLGVDNLADVFQVAWTIVTFVSVVQLTMVTSLLVPSLQTTTEGTASFGRSRLPLMLGTSASLLQAVGAILGADGDLRVLLLVSAPAHFFVGAAAVPQALAYIGKRFWVAGLGPIANGVALLTVTLIGMGNLNALVLGLAVTAGYAAQWMTTTLGTRDLASAANSAHFIRFKLFLGVLVFTLVSKFQPVLERIVSYQLTTGATAALGYGQKIAQGLVLFATFGFATAATASLARHSESANIRAAANLLAHITLATFVFGSIVCSLALPAAYPIVVVLFQRGVFRPEESWLVANVVVAQLPWVWAGAVAGVFTAYLYVDRRYAQVLLASFAGLGTTLLCALAVSTFLPEYAVAIASSAGAVAAPLVHIAILRRTAVWHDYWKLLTKRWRLGATAIIELAVSCALFVAIRTTFNKPSVVVCTLTTLVMVIITVAIFLFIRPVRAELRQVMNAKL